MVNPPATSATDSVSGKALYKNYNQHSGITVTLEKMDGLKSMSAIFANRNIAEGSRAIAVSKAVAAGTQTKADGSYTFENMESGIYTVYASSRNSSEK